MIPPWLLMKNRVGLPGSQHRFPEHPAGRNAPLLWSCFIILVLLLALPASAFTVTPPVMTPSDILNPNDPVNLSWSVYAASGTAFPSYDDLQFVTELDDPVWKYSVIVNGVENVRPADRGKILTISGFELAYQNRDEVVVQAVLSATVPGTAPPGANRTLLKIQELDARSTVIPTSVVRFSHLIGQPTPAPIPSTGTLRIRSSPPGAGVYLDNVIRGISPLTLDAVPNGRYAILLRRDGYQDYTTDVVVTGDAPLVSAELVPQPAATPATPAVSGGASVNGSTGTPPSPPVSGPGTLSIATSPPGAVVYVDSEAKGITPATIPGLSPGKHTIHLVMNGYEDFSTSMEISPGTTAEYVTGLVKTKKTPGFTAAGALIASGLALGFGTGGRVRDRRNRKSR